MPIRVIVFKRSGRKNFEAQWADPLTGKKKTKSAKTPHRRDAERFAARLEEQLNSGGLRADGRTLWVEINKAYEDEILAAKKAKDAGKIRGTLNLIQELLEPKWIGSIDVGAVAKFAKGLRKRGIEAITIRAHLAELKKLLEWAKRRNFISVVPAVELPKVTRGARGRAILVEEFEAMIEAIPQVMGLLAAPSWEFFLRGLWLSGMRLGEALRLSWDHGAPIAIDLSGRQPVLRFAAEAHKRGEDVVSPVAPDFAEYLGIIPEDQRRGLVFRIAGERMNQVYSTEYISQRISDIGKTAGVKAKRKWASAHDLRRSFGARWAPRVMPAVLQKLMRHESIQTTMQFYATREAMDASEAVWQAVANDFANTGPENLFPAKDSNLN
jgi:integrase